MKRPVLVAFFALIVTATLAIEPRAAQLSPDATIPLPATNDYAANILAGISNQDIPDRDTGWPVPRHGSPRTG